MRFRAVSPTSDPLAWTELQIRGAVNTAATLIQGAVDVTVSAGAESFEALEAALPVLLGVLPL